MSNPYLDLQSEVALRLAASVLLAPIPIITEAKGNIEARIQTALAKGGVSAGSTSKAGLAFLVFTPSGRNQNSSVRSRTVLAQLVTVRVALFARPLINDGPSGHGLAPLAVQFAAQAQLLTWNRGPGQPPISLEVWDSEETNAEISFYTDFSVPLTLNLSAA